MRKRVKVSAMAFDRAAFESKVSERSPLSPEQFDKMLGKVDKTNKVTAWQLMQMSAKAQFTIWQVVKEFPEARVETIR